MPRASCGHLRGPNCLTLLVAADRDSTPLDPGRRSCSGLARRSSPASKLKILPDRSLLAEGPAEAGPGLLASRDPRIDPFDDEFAFVLSLVPIAASLRFRTSPATSPSLADVCCLIRCWDGAHGIWPGQA